MILALAAAAAPLFAAARDARVDWLAANAVRVRTLDPHDDDFADLEPLRKTLAGLRVVMLGEQNHGDGTTFLAKTRLIRFLHERMGFDVLAFESGLYDCAKAWEHLAAGEPARTAVPRGVFAIWTKSREVEPLIDYLGAQAKSAHPLELAGVDCQLTASASKDFLIADLHAQGFSDERVDRVIPHLIDGTWESGTVPLPSVEERAAFAKTIAQWRAAATSPYWRQVIESIGVFAESEWLSTADSAESTAVRDRQMGKNLVWLARKRYPNRKIIVWAATFHNARNVRTIETSDAKLRRFYATDTPMGEVAKNALGKELYSLGVTSYDGESANAFAKSAKPLPPSTPGSLEDLFVRAGLTDAVVDFHRAPRWLQAPMLSQIIGHIELRADWTRIVDGVLFIRHMERSHKK
jgi:erythromycin esterase